MTPAFGFNAFGPLALISELTLFKLYPDPRDWQPAAQITVNVPESLTAADPFAAQRARWSKSETYKTKGFVKEALSLGKDRIPAHHVAAVGQFLPLTSEDNNPKRQYRCTYGHNKGETAPGINDHDPSFWADNKCVNAAT